MMITTSFSSSLSHALNRSTESYQASIERMSKDRNVITASDAPESISRLTSLNKTVSGLGSANKNLNDAVSYTMTAGDALETIKGHLLDIRDLSIQYKNGTNSQSDKIGIESSVKDHILAIQHTFKTVKYNDKNVLDDGRVFFQVGMHDGDMISVKASAQSVNKALTVDRSKLESFIKTEMNGGELIKNIDGMVDTIDKNIIEFSSVQNRLTMAMDINDISIRGAQSSIDNIQKVDFAKEVENITKQAITQNIISQMMVNVNDQRSLVLALLK